MADGTEAGSEYLERAQGLAPLIEASADQAERERRLPEPLFTALVEAGLFRLLLPRSLDGAEVDPVTFVRVVENIAKRDASTSLHHSRTAMARPGGWRRVRPPRGRAQWAPLVPSAARRAAFGRVGDGAGPAGAAPCARTRPPHATTVRE
jgi:alkylation response protein AidB-like acyl-CoA dehydrogenase